MRTITICLVGIIAIATIGTAAITTIARMDHDREVTKQYELQYNSNCK